MKKSDGLMVVTSVHGVSGAVLGSLSLLALLGLPRVRGELGKAHGM